MPDQRAGESLRDLFVGCVRCGWSVTLKASLAVPDNYDITALNGWEIGDEKGPLCERCAKGWTPSLVARDADAIGLAVAYRMQASWHPDHQRVVATVLAVIETGEWRSGLDTDPPVVLGSSSAQSCADVSDDKEAAVQLPIGPDSAT